MLSELQKNSLDQMARTLSDLASSERQLAYKKAVPFVHVPIELFAQWDSYVRMLGEADWFSALFSESERAAIKAYDVRLESFRARQAGRCLDVDEIFAHPEWQQLMKAAAELLDVLHIYPEK